MINPQYTYDTSGNKIGVFLPIEDWYQLKSIPGVEEISTNEAVIPEWQIELGEKELQNIAEGNTELMEWDKAKLLFKL